MGEVKLNKATDLAEVVKKYAGQTLDVVYVRNTMRDETKMILD
jgi:hypothetical protein